MEIIEVQKKLDVKESLILQYNIRLGLIDFLCKFSIENPNYINYEKLLNNRDDFDIIIKKILG